MIRRLLMRAVTSIVAAVVLSMPLLATFARVATAEVAFQVPPPRLNAKSYFLIDHDSGRVLVEHDANLRVEPASITKIMTVYAAGHALSSGLIRLEDETRVSEKAWKMEGSRMFIEVGKTVSIDDLLQGVVVQSGNDASVALAEHISGTEDVFSGIMSGYAKQLGMTNSGFTNSTGLPDPDTYTTARDIAILSSALIDEFPALYARFAIREFTYNDIRQPNRNRLLMRDDTVDGIKTGHTKAAGYCLVSSALRDEMRLITAVMGTESDEARTQASQALLNYGFRFFETRRLYSAADAVAAAKIWRGAVDSIELGPRQTTHITIPRGSYDELDAVANIDEPILAPVSKGDVLEKVVVNLNREVLLEVSLVALSDVSEGSFFSRLYDNVMLIFE